MKKGSIVKGLFITGVLDYIEEEMVIIRYAKHRYAPYINSSSRILITNVRETTKKEKEEYKKFLLKNGYSYYRGKVTKEL